VASSVGQCCVGPRETGDARAFFPAESPGAAKPEPAPAGAEKAMADDAPATAPVFRGQPQEAPVPAAPQAAAAAEPVAARAGSGEAAARELEPDLPPPAAAPFEKPAAPEQPAEKPAEAGKPAEAEKPTGAQAASAPKEEPAVKEVEAAPAPKEEALPASDGAEVEPAPELEPAAKQDEPAAGMAATKEQDAPSPPPPTLKAWVVVGGDAEKGGIVVREGESLRSTTLPRLATGAKVEQLERIGDRVHFRKLEGDGPKEGWVSFTVKGKELLAPA